MDFERQRYEERMPEHRPVRNYEGPGAIGNQNFDRGYEPSYGLDNSRRGLEGGYQGPHEFAQRGFRGETQGGYGEQQFEGRGNVQEGYGGVNYDQPGGPQGGYGPLGSEFPHHHNKHHGGGGGYEGQPGAYQVPGAGPQFGPQSNVGGGGYGGQYGRNDQYGGDGYDTASAYNNDPNVTRPARLPQHHTANDYYNPSPGYDTGYSTSNMLPQGNDPYGTSYADSRSNYDGSSSYRSNTGAGAQSGYAAPSGYNDPNAAGAQPTVHLDMLDKGIEALAGKFGYHMDDAMADRIGSALRNEFKEKTGRDFPY